MAATDPTPTPGAGEGPWILGDGEQPVAELTVDGGNFPWLEASVTRLPGFEAVAPLFATSLDLLESTDGFDGWDAAYRRIKEATTLTKPDGSSVPEYLLHIDDDRAWWRWSDEPFDDEEAAAQD